MSKYPSLSALAQSGDVIVLGIDWSAWVRLKTHAYGTDVTMINDPTSPDSVLTRYGWRQWVGSAGTDPSWYFLGTGNTAAELARAEDWDTMLTACNIDRGFDWYPSRADISVGTVPNVADIYDAGIGYYLASPKAGKFWLILQASWIAYDGNNPGTWGNYTAFVANVVALCQNDRYRRISYGGIANRPVIGLYKTPNPDWDSTHLATLTTAITNAGLGSPFYLQMNMDVTDANALGCHGITAYGPNGSSPAGSGQKSYNTQVLKDRANDTVLGANQSRIFCLTAGNDGRATTFGGNPWVDHATYTEIEQHIRDRFAGARGNFVLNPKHMICVYSITENSECGPFAPTAQGIARGVNAPSWGIFMDAFRNVKNGSFPSTYDDYLHAQALHADLSAMPAGWAAVQDLWGTGGTGGASQYTELQNTTTTNARTLTTTCTRIRVYGGLGTGLGTTRFIVDGGANNDVNQNDGGARRYNQLLFDTGVLSNASHTLSVARVSGTSCYDEFRISRSR